MLETKADVNENVMSALNGIVDDEGHWVTINGHHVLINEKGEVQSGLGGKFNGRKISKFKAPPTHQQLSTKYGEVAHEKETEEGERYRIEQSKEYKKAKRGLDRLDKILDGNEGRRIQYWNPEKYASLVALREEYSSQLKGMLEGQNRKIENLRERERNIGNALRRGKNGVYTNQTEKEKKLAEHLSNAKYNRLDRERKIKAKTDAIESKYTKMAERIQNRYKDSDDWREQSKGERLAYTVKNRGEQLAQNVRENARTGMSWSNRKSSAERRNDAELAKVENKNRALEKFKDRAKRIKLANAREANEFVKNQKGTRVSKATPNMVGGEFDRPGERAKRYREYAQKEKGAISRAFNEGAISHERVAKSARQTLAKARPRIEARRQAVKAFNERNAPKETSSKVLTMFDKDMAKAEKSYEDFKDVMNRRKNEIDVLRERLRTTKNGFIAKATAQDLEKRIKEYNELDEMY